MQLSDFSFDLPPELIATEPTQQRTACRLLQLDRLNGDIQHYVFHDLLQLLAAGDLLVLNNTQVIPARLFGYKSTGGQLELLVERLLPEQQLLVQLRASKPPTIGSLIQLTAPNGQPAVSATVIKRQGNLFQIQIADNRPLLTLLQAIGHIPLPPYLQRPATVIDQQYYQTVFARVPGAVAAPTAGLHFDQALLQALQAKGIEITEITLQVGAGTFQPIRSESIQAHQMHAEVVSVNQAAVEAILACKARGGRVVAVGTTAVRALETAAAAPRQQSEQPLLQPFEGETRLFIYPGYRFQVVDSLITNFHLPCSSLLLLVCAFAGQSSVLAAYQQAIAQRYRFFSYGDAMLIQSNGAIPLARATPKACAM
ncbi:MAG: tRNA preQ1(34) S-adenosylmethionine ribosyltransferase-isomerase QueA [Candidatus Symbiodolus clandestinus]